MAQTMFERYGGFVTVSRIVSSFYDKVMDSPELAGYFAGIDMKKLIDHQTKFIAALMGGPVAYTNEHLERVHANLAIKATDFDEAVALLRETFEDFEMDETDIANIHSDIMSRKKFIVTER